MNLFKTIDLKEGVLSNLNACILADVKLELQKFNLIEDIVQIYFKHNDSFIDIGWYPVEFEITQKSYFSVRAFTDDSWNNLVYKKKCKSIKKLIINIEEAIILLGCGNGKVGSVSD